MEEATKTSFYKRRALLISVLVLAAVAMLILIVYWMYPTTKYAERFEVPKITTAHVDEEPFARVPLAPGESYRPIEIMAETEVDANCEVVSTTKKTHFRLVAFEKEMHSDDCVFRFKVPETVGLTTSLIFEFRDGDVSEPTDVMSVPVIVVEKGWRMEFHAIEDENGKPLDSVSVPQRVKIYGKAITHLTGSSRDYVALFFLADPIKQVPVLQLMPMKEGEKSPKPLIGTFVQYRRWGQEFEGYAFWSPVPIDLGGDSSERRVVDVYAGVFRLDAVPEVVSKSVEITLREDSVVLRPLLRDVESLRALTVDGRHLSPPLHLVRGPGVAEVNKP